MRTNVRAVCARTYTHLLTYTQKYTFKNFSKVPAFLKEQMQDNFCIATVVKSHINQANIIRHIQGSELHTRWMTKTTGCH